MKKILFYPMAIVILVLGISSVVLAGLFTETILGRQLIGVSQDQKIIELQSELIVSRSIRTSELTGKTWGQYKKEAYKFPLLQSIPPSANKRNIDWTLFDYSGMSLATPNFVVVATDNSSSAPFDILVQRTMATNNPEGIFLIRQPSYTPDAVYGPFFDNLDRLKGEIPGQPTKRTSSITIMVPENYELYKKQMTEFVQAGGADPLKTMQFVKKSLVVPFTTDLVRASAQAAAAEISPSGGPAKASVSYLKVQGGTAYVLLDIDLDGWAGASVSIAIIHPLVEKTLLLFPEIKRVVFSYANTHSSSVPIDTSFRITNIGNSQKPGEPNTSVFPIYAFGCDATYSKINFYISKDVVGAPTILLGTTAGGSGGSGECDLFAEESSLSSKLLPGKYRIWAVRYLENVADKRTADVKITIVKIAI